PPMLRLAPAATVSVPAPLIVPPVHKSDPDRLMLPLFVIDPVVRRRFDPAKATFPLIVCVPLKSMTPAPPSHAPLFWLVTLTLLNWKVPDCTRIVPSLSSGAPMFTKLTAPGLTRIVPLLTTSLGVLEKNELIGVPGRVIRIVPPARLLIVPELRLIVPPVLRKVLPKIKLAELFRIAFCNSTLPPPESEEVGEHANVPKLLTDRLKVPLPLAWKNPVGAMLMTPLPEMVPEASRNAPVVVAL